MKKIVYILIVTSLFFASCHSEKQKDGIKKTEDMLVKIETLTALINSDEVSAYSDIYDTTKVYNAYFKTLPPNFERTDSIMDIIYHYGTVEKCFKKLHSKHLGPLLAELEKSKFQISNLQHDIENGFFEDNQIDEYVNTEDSILIEIENLINSNLEFAENHKVKFEKYHPMVVNLKKEFEEKYQ